MVVPYGSNDTAAKVFFMTLNDQMIKQSGEFVEGNSFMYIPTGTKFIERDIVLIDI